MKNPFSYRRKPASQPNLKQPKRLERLRLPEDDRTFRMTPALDRAGYRAPDDMLLREGYTVRLARRRAAEDPA